ncbi:MAG: DUF935 family protein [Actinomycetota bacterium]|nr:DUF935 family protein [Actinomycetota bacterium]
MPEEKDMPEQDAQVTTPQNVARIIEDALDQPKNYPQADKKPVTDEIASAISDPFWAYYVGKKLINPDKTLRNVGGGFDNNLEIFEMLQRDPQVLSHLQTRRLAVSGKEWEVQPASNKRKDVQIGNFVKQALLNFDFDRACFNLLQGVLLGFKVSEIMWEYSSGNVWVKEMIARPSRRFAFGLRRELRLITRDAQVEGAPVPPKKFQLFVYGGDNGSPYGDGLGSSLYWPVWFKKNAIKFWMVFSEKFGSPTAVGKYPSGTPKEQQDALLAALDAIQQETAIKIPDTMQVAFLEAQRNGSMQNYETLCSFMNAEIAKIILGQTLTSEAGHSGRGSSGLAAARVHDEVRAEYAKADSDALSNALNRQLIRWIVDYNFGPQVAYPKFWRKMAAQDTQALAERDQILINSGVEIPQSYFYETYDVPAPQPGDKLAKPIKGGSQAASDSSGGSSFSSSPRRRESRLTFREGKCACGHHHSFAEPGADDQNWIDQYMERIAPAIAALSQDAAEKVAAWLASQKTPPTQAKFVSQIQGIVGDELVKIDQAAASDLASQMYQWYSTTGGLSPNIDVVFGGADLRTSDFLNQLDSFYLSKFINNPDVNASLVDFLTKQYIEGGDGLFGRGSMAGIQDFAKILENNLVNLSEGQIRRIVDTGVMRARNWAHINQAYKAGIKQLRVQTLPGACEECVSIVDSEEPIDVSDAYDEMQKQASMSPDDYSEYLKNNDMLTPPFHPFCRCYVVIA